MSAKRDYYEILGLDKSASEADIKSAYRKAALKYHPDRNKAADAEEKFKEINEAYQVLSDKQKRQTYDQFGHAAFDPSSGMGGGAGPFSGFDFSGFGRADNPPGPFSWSYTRGGDAGGGFDFSDPFEIFEQFFGSGFARARRPRYGINISFMEAVKGTEKEITLENGKKKKIKIPAGVDNGTRIRFDDFDVSIDVGTHPRFRRDNADVFVDEQIPFSLAALGGQLTVQTLNNGELKLKIRPGTQSHTLIRLRGEGIKRLRGRGVGDMYVRLIVKVPEKLTREQKRILEEWKKFED
jgi:DnaJ-class molecular chaperone